MCFESESVTECLPDNTVFLTDCFLWTDHEGFFACHSFHAHFAYLLLRDCVWLCGDPLQPLWVNHNTHAHTHNTHTHTHWLTKAWKQSDEGLCWQAEELAAAPGRAQSHRRMEGGGGREREEVQTLIYQSYKSRLVTADIHHSDRQTELRALQCSVPVSGLGKDFELIYNNI